MIAVSRRGAIAVAAVALTSLLSGCSGLLSSSLAETAEEPAAGSNARAGSMLVRNAFVLGPEPGAEIPAGDSAAVYLTLYDNGHGDELVGASADGVAAEVNIAGDTIQVPPKELVQVGTGQESIILRELREPMNSGDNVELTLSFARTGTIRMSLPVLPRTGPYASLSPAASPTATTTATGSPSPDSSSPRSTAAGGH